MIQSYYKSPSNDFTLIQGDCNATLSKFSFGFDMVFADPPYFLSSGGISCQSGRVVCVDKGDWDKSKTPEEMDAFNLRWLTSVRNHMKDNATIWISGTYHNIFSVQQQLIRLGFKNLHVGDIVYLFMSGNGHYQIRYKLEVTNTSVPRQDLDLSCTE